jgi:acyl-coenzyme A thioesterase PaaI-like protein
MAFTFELLTDLVRLHLVDVATGTVTRGGRAIQVARVRITQAARDALAAES